MPARARRHSVAGVPLRRRLFLLAAVGIVPLVVVAGVGLYALAQQQRAQAERIGLELARALATAVDGELRSSASALQALATDAALERHDLVAFRDGPSASVATQANWAAVFLADPSGKRLLDTRFPPGATLSPIFDRDSFDRVVRTRVPAVGNLARSPQGGLLFPVRAAVPPHRRAPLRAHRAREARGDPARSSGGSACPGTGSSRSSTGTAFGCARSRAHEENLGGRASSTLQALMAGGGEEGVGQTIDLEGGRIYASFSRLQGERLVGRPGHSRRLHRGGGAPLAGDLRQRDPALDRARGGRGDRGRPQHQSADRGPAGLGPRARPARAARVAGHLDPGDSRRGGRARDRGRRAREQRGAARRAPPAGAAGAGGGGGRRSGEGRVSRGALARAADAAQRGLRLGADAARAASSTGEAAAAGARRRSCGTPMRRCSSSTTCSTCPGSSPARCASTSARSTCRRSSRRPLDAVAAGRGGQGHPAPDRARSASGSDHRRSRSPPAGRVEPADQRGEVHPEGRAASRSSCSA